MPTACTVRCPRHLAANNLVDAGAVDILRSAYDLLQYVNKRAWEACDCNLMARIDALLGIK